MLSVDHLTVTYGETVAVDDVSLELPQGQVLAVLGPSGCGKSSLLRAVAGLEPVGAGTVAFDGRDLTHVPTHRRGFALMFQDGQLFPHLSVARNVAYALRLRRAPRAEVAARIAELLELVGLPGYGDRPPVTLSGGERQRVALARSLAARPRLLLLDEPLSALDRGLREHLAGELREILRAERTTALLVTHDHEEAFAVADRLAVMREGRLVQTGTLEEVWRSPADAPTARFLGYAAVLDGATVGWPAAGTVAVRRSALVVSPDGPLRATVLAARTTPEQTRLSVRLATGPVVDAVAPLDVAVRPDQDVRLRLDRSRAAVLATVTGDVRNAPPGASQPPA